MTGLTKLMSIAGLVIGRGTFFSLFQTSSLLSWRKLPQVSFFVVFCMLVGTKTIVAINYVCRDKHMFDKTFVMINIVASNIIFLRQNTTTHLSRQNTTTCAKTFVAEKLCLLRQIFVAGKVLSRRTHVCRDKHNFVTTSIFLSRQKTCFVATKNYTCVSSRQ